MLGLLTVIFAGSVWAQADFSDQGITQTDKRNSWKTQKVVYCDSTIVPMQRCRDLTPCSPKYLDCTKGPNRCVCEIINPVAGGASSELKSIVERISTIPSLSTFGFVIKDPHFSDYVSLLNKAGPMTLFVPTNDAFQNAGVDTSNYQQMKEILKYHLIPNDALLTSNLFPFQVVPNALGNSIKVSKDQNVWMVDNAKVLLPDLRVSNGVIWLIDRVLTPQMQGTQDLQSQGFSGFVQEQRSFSNLNQGNFQGMNQDQGAKGDFQVGSFRVGQGNFVQQGQGNFIPGQGQGNFLQQGQGQGNFLQQGNGMVQGQGLGQGTQEIQQKSFQQGGIGQGQGNFVQQGQNTQGAQGLVGQVSGQRQGIQQRNFQSSDSFSNGQGQVKSIAERVMGNPQLTTFAFLLNDPRYSEIVQYLSGPGPLTVFIPTNEAFLKSGIDTTNVPMVRELLKHHIAPNMAVTSVDFAPFQKLFTVQGEKLKISQVNSDWMINDAKILVPDVMAKNGVIFVIDRVLLPTQMSQLQGAIRGNVQGSQGFQGQTSQGDNQKGDWHGAGLYCAQSELYYCNEKTECVLQESCKNGCVRADPGFPDYCFVPDLKTSSAVGGLQLPNLQLPNFIPSPWQQAQRSQSGRGY